jgi:predicted DNA-binding protein with PD1-like motif
MTFPALSRRRYLALSAMGCGCAIGTPRASLAATQIDELPAGYTAPGAPIVHGGAPRMHARLIEGRLGGPRTYAVVFGKGDEAMSGLTEWAQREGIAAAHLTAIGAFSAVMFGWFDAGHRAYRNIPVDQQVECISLIGDVGLFSGKPALHVHGSVGLPDGSVRGGHLIRATVWPTLEVFVSVADGVLDKERDEETGLWLFDLQR